MKYSFLIIYLFIFFEALAAEQVDHFSTLGKLDAAAIKECRAFFPEVELNPGADGGWRSFSFDNKNFVCVYGSELNLVLERFSGVISRLNELTLIVRSSGGKVSDWLEVAEVLEGRVNKMIVDEFCFSSCVLYFPVIAKRVLTTKPSFLVWHGGPHKKNKTLADASAVSIKNLIQFEDIIKRTEDMYKRNFINTDILNISFLPPSRHQIEIIKRKNEKEGKIIAGYSFTKSILKNCFGFIGIDDIWHAGKEELLEKEISEFNERLIILIYPESNDVSESMMNCFKNN